MTRLLAFQVRVTQLLAFQVRVTAAVIPDEETPGAWVMAGPPETVKAPLIARQSLARTAAPVRMM